jgi:hypothetical protein
LIISVSSLLTKLCPKTSTFKGILVVYIWKNSCRMIWKLKDWTKVIST